jgi:hypothetical protein
VRRKDTDLRHEAACRWLARGMDLRAISSCSATPISRRRSDT